MSIYLHELRSNKISIIIWTAVVSFMLATCILIYPLMEAAMKEMSDMLANMGSVSDAFGMTSTTFTDINGYFAVECGELIGLCGSIFAAIISIMSLAKEERNHSAEFLLTHPVSRTKIILDKLLSIISALIIFNLISLIVSAVSYVAIGEKFNFGTIGLIFLANFLLQLEIAGICFGISAFLKGNGIGIGIGISMGFYFISMISKITEKTEFLKYITPYSYADNSYIVNEGSLEIKFLIIGLVVTIAGIVTAFVKYNKKDIS